MAQRRKSIGEVIRALRVRSKITRHALAKAAGVDPAMLARLEEEDRPGVQFATVYRLAQALGVGLDDLAAQVGLTKIRPRAPRSAVPPALTLAHGRAARALLVRALQQIDEILEKQ